MIEFCGITPPELYHAANHETRRAIQYDRMGPMFATLAGHCRTEARLMRRHARALLQGEPK